MLHRQPSTGTVAHFQRGSEATAQQRDQVGLGKLQVQRSAGTLGNRELLLLGVIAQNDAADTQQGEHAHIGQAGVGCYGFDGYFAGGEVVEGFEVGVGVGVRIRIRIRIRISVSVSVSIGIGIGIGVSIGVSIRIRIRVGIGIGIG
ncbi:hypothetical protein C1X82_34775, partial [Pseudomonas sp. GP01-A11]